MGANGPIRASYTVPSGAQFGAPRAGGRHHQGTDYHCPVGTPIYATGDGRVVANVGETGYGIGFGNYVSISYANGRVTLDGHMVSRSPLAVGTIVNSDTIVGGVGTTGNAVYADPPGSHVHHQVWLNGVLTDPAAYYGTALAGSTGTPINSTEGTFMALTDAEQVVLYKSIANIESAIPSILLTLKLVAQPVLRDTTGDGTAEEVTQIQDNADTNTMVRQLLTQTTPASTGGTSTADLIALLKPMFDALPAAVRAAIIK